VTFSAVSTLQPFLLGASAITSIEVTFIAGRQLPWNGKDDIHDVAERLPSRAGGQCVSIYEKKDPSLRSRALQGGPGWIPVMHKYAGLFPPYCD
jgi:hypothetical protein